MTTSHTGAALRVGRRAVRGQRVCPHLPPRRATAALALEQRECTRSGAAAARGRGNPPRRVIDCRRGLPMLPALAAALLLPAAAAASGVPLPRATAPMVEVTNGQETYRYEKGIAPDDAGAVAAYLRHLGESRP